MPHQSRGHFGDLERAILEVLWREPERAQTVREVTTEVGRERDIAYTTTMTVLDRMTRKGLLDQERAGRAYTYRARLTRADLTAELMRRTLDEVAPEHRSHALVAFVGDADAEDLAALRAALERIDPGGSE